MSAIIYGSAPCNLGLIDLAPKEMLFWMAALERGHLLSLETMRDAAIPGNGFREALDWALLRLAHPQWQEPEIEQDEMQVTIRAYGPDDNVVSFTILANRIIHCRTSMLGPSERLVYALDPATMLLVSDEALPAILLDLPLDRPNP
jgi:hypothetical protein